MIPDKVRSFAFSLDFNISKNSLVYNGYNSLQVRSDITDEKDKQVGI